MKPQFENNWLSKSLESLEKDYWKDEIEYSSHLIETCHTLRKKPLKDLQTEDLRIMIGQDIGLLYLIPLAIEVLQKDILASGDFYEGDLLQSVLTSDTNYWKNELDNWQKVYNLFHTNENLLKQFDIINPVKGKWFNAFAKFEKIH
ncbi:MAG TPA: contact-dependent growth inhibition system immunity protein [Chitinophagales bacterium]